MLKAALNRRIDGDGVKLGTFPCVFAYEPMGKALENGRLTESSTVILIFLHAVKFLSLTLFIHPLGCTKLVHELSFTKASY